MQSSNKRPEPEIMNTARPDALFGLAAFPGHSGDAIGQGEAGRCMASSDAASQDCSRPRCSDENVQKTPL